MSDSQRHHLMCFVKHSMLMGKYAVGGIPGAENKSCAVVSNSGAMLKHSHGEDIDSHDIVIRANDAAIDTFEPYVGKKYSHRFGWNMKVNSTKETYLYCNNRQD